MNKNWRISIDMSGIWEIAIFVFLIFLVMKITNLITWTWVWVFSPIWIAGGIWLVLFLFLVLVMLVERLRD